MGWNFTNQNKFNLWFKLVTLLSFVTLVVMSTGCTSSDNKEQAAAATTDELESSELADDGSSNPESSEAMTSSASPEEALAGEQPPADDIVADLGDDMAKDQPADLPEQPLGEEATPMDAVAPTDQTAEVAPPVEESAADQNTFSDMAATEPPAEEPVPMEEPAPIPQASLKKIKDAPFTSNGRILNTVYVARKGDTLKSVSQKLFGSNKTKQLKADNGFLSRGVKPGDKIYYNSPLRPDDSSTMMTYYEDKGIPAQSYTAAPGENIRSISKKLLGFGEAWKEVWATNPNVESKGALAAGTELRYWPEGSDVAPPAMEISPPVAEVPPPPPMDPPPELPPPPPMDMAQTPPPTDPNAAAGTVDMPLPPPASDMNAPPPPPPVARKKDASSSPFMIEDEQTTMAIGIGIVTFFTAILLTSFIIKKGRSRKMKLGQTQV
ncbi:MAG: LysM peptidoglycan-binding domain-containing protein [Bdellovibrionales bacterium]